MKRIWVLVALAGGLVSCGSSSASDPHSATADIAGTWIGTTGSGEAGKTFALNLSVAASGSVTGSGVVSTWSADNAGKVTGGGTFSVVSWGEYKTLHADWSLQLNAAKTQLTGSVATSDAFIQTVIVTLNKN